MANASNTYYLLGSAVGPHPYPWLVRELQRVIGVEARRQMLEDHGGLPEHAVRLLEDDRLLLVFPEGARGTAKLFKDRNSLVRFGTGFMRLALQTGTPIVPTAPIAPVA